MTQFLLSGGPVLCIQSVAFGRCLKKKAQKSQAASFPRPPLGGAFVKVRKPPQPAGIG